MRERFMPRLRGRRSLEACTDYGVTDTPDWRKVDWRRHMRAVTVAGRRVHVLDIGGGGGAPIVFVHGLGGRWQNWLENIPRLAQHRRVVAFDLPGFGNSQLPVGQVTIPGYAAVVDVLCDRLELDPAVVVGSSMGGFIALEAALSHSERVASLVLVDVAYASVRDLEPSASILLLAALARSPLASPARIRAALRRPRSRTLAFAPLIHRPDRIAADMLAELGRGTGAPGSRGAFLALNGHTVIARLGEVEVPTLVIHGRYDLLIPLSDSLRLHRLLADSRLEVIEGSGHLPMVERPTHFNDTLLEFIGAAS